jgi:hypothetical protein
VNPKERRKGRLGIEKVLGRLMELKGERDKLLSRQSLLHRPHHDDGFAKKIQIIFLDKKTSLFSSKTFLQS